MFSIDVDFISENWIFHPKNVFIPQSVVILILCLSLVRAYFSIAAVLVVFCSLLYFFRNPKPTSRARPETTGLGGDSDIEIDSRLDSRSDTVLAPSYGTVSNIMRDHSEHAVLISIFLSVFDVHSQYAPVNCSLIDTKYHQGQFNNAQLFEKTRLNERKAWRFRDDASGRHIGVSQISGMIARAIVTFDENKKSYSKGEPFGMIRMGSRVDIILPKEEGLQIHVSEGERVFGPDTVIASYHPSGPATHHLHLHRSHLELGDTERYQESQYYVQ